ncbi:Similar to tomm20b: Mitochondrial import receptor subunit TOM20 homolog B (Danio rerio) [Cotesia congregata]|uniref:Similar to tomm20b: Mitochondrial import receptor subunit TOM20 homolog B (Danio rerio) n=1 Tax=Cotesia congregata TaxID=51543 RepID=A0A8J2HGM6_COTCN|nr:Similar to tomm20b: Mitochondrial import receptor subunit TOM20 homolog B (Danio rerio) [Cotesia congregata]
MTMSKAAVGIAVGIAGLFVGYCFYFDKKRRSDPEFKNKLRERRKAKKQAQRSGTVIPDLKDPEVVQKFFLQQVQLGEELLANGDLEGGIEHLANAVAVCGQPQELLRRLVSQTTMADEDVE